MHSPLSSLLSFLFLTFAPLMFGIELTEDLLWKFLRFALVGVSGTAIDFGLTYMSKDVFKINKYAANAFGFAVAASSNYYFNRVFTFQSHSTDIGMEYARFILVALVGLGINTVILHLAETKLKRGFWMAKIIATGVTLLWNFFGSKAIAFR